MRALSGCRSVRCVLAYPALATAISILISRQLLLTNQEIKNVDFHPEPVQTSRGGKNDPRRRRLDLLPENSTRRVAFVLFSYLQYNNTLHFENFVLSAVKTWAAPTTASSGNLKGANEDEVTYVVLAEPCRGPFDSVCSERSTESNPERRKLCRRIKPIYVDCPEGRSYDAPSCKQQKGLVSLWDGNYPLYDWYVFMDDDTYIRKEYLSAILLTYFQPPDFPMAAVQWNQEPIKFPSPKSNCSKSLEFTYPLGQPIFYSRGAMRTLIPGFRAGSLVKQAKEFQRGSPFPFGHDAVNAIVHWMYSLPLGRLPPLPSLPFMKGYYIGSHWVGRMDQQDIYIKRKKHSRNLNSLNFSFEEVHLRYTTWKNMSHPELPWEYEPKFYHNSTGFQRTVTYQKYGHPSTWGPGVWHTMPYSDCSRG